MPTQITVRIRFTSERKIEKTIVRKLIFDEDELGRKNFNKFGLTRDGEWLEIEEGQSYPPECFLDTQIYDPTLEI
jgi:hypothetical protein